MERKQLVNPTYEGTTEKPVVEEGACLACYPTRYFPGITVILHMATHHNGAREPNKEERIHAEVARALKREGLFQ